jgi:hypothetical protein
MFAAPSGRRRVFCSGTCRESSRRAAAPAQEPEAATPAGNGDVPDAAAPKRKLTPTERLAKAGGAYRRILAEGNWSGWIWLSKKKLWQKICDAGSIGECRRELGRLASERGVPDKHSCLTRGGCPSWTPSER